MVGNPGKSPWLGATVFSVATVLGGAFSFAGAPPAATATLVTFAPDRWRWIVVFWVAAVIGAIQAFWALHRAKSVAEVALVAARRDLERKKQNQQLSDWLSEQWEFGIHELLNKPPAEDNDASFAQWRDRVNDWRVRVIDEMKERGCSVQEVRSVNTLGLIPFIPIHKNPGVAHAMSMLAVRLDRIADVAKRYGD